MKAQKWLICIQGCHLHSEACWFLSMSIYSGIIMLILSQSHFVPSAGCELAVVAAAASSLYAFYLDVFYVRDVLSTFRCKKTQKNKQVCLYQELSMEASWCWQQ